MCDCQLLVSRQTDQPIEIASDQHKFTYTRHGKVFDLLDGFHLEGVIDYAAVHRIVDAYGVKKGYMFVIGEQ